MGKFNWNYNRDLSEYITEMQSQTSSNKERLEQLKKWLQDKKYPDFVKTLNKMLDDPKAKTLLEDGFGGELGDVKFKFAAKEIKAKDLRPTQAEIDIDKSLKHVLDSPNNVDKFFMAEAIESAGMPIITFNGKYVIDGHHRWSEACMVNPECLMKAFDYSGDVTPVQMLKAVQGSIAAVIAQNNRNGKIPSNKVEGQNVYKMSKEDIVEYVNEHMTDAVAERFVECCDSIKVAKHAAPYIITNVMKFKDSCKPVAGAPNRGEMPQPSKAGTKEGDKSSAYPNKDGSALNKLKDGKIDKDVIK